MSMALAPQVQEMIIAIKPMPAPRARVDRGRGHDTQKYAAWKDEARFLLRSLRPEKHEIGHLAVECSFYVKNVDGVRGDIDNYVKSLFDACKGFTWTDDKQVTELHTYIKTAGRAAPFITMSVQNLDHGKAE